MLTKPGGLARPLPPQHHRRLQPQPISRNHTMLLRQQLPGLGAAANASTCSSSVRQYMLSLERSVGEGAGKDTPLRATNAFGAEVFPDLPIATTWDNLWKVMRRQASQSVPSRAATELPGGDVAMDKIKVMTVAANLRSLKEIEARMRAATTSDKGPEGASSAPGQLVPTNTGRAADALLLVSGSHPVRTLPGSRQLLPTSITTLQLARRLREQGSLPASTQLWAVANPSVEPDASMAERKVDQGAQVLLTQPPFDMESFISWVEDARARGVLERAHLLVGHPMISSSGNLAFWLSLSSCVGRPRCRSLLLDFSSQEARDKAGMDEFCSSYNQQVTSQVLSWEGVGGFHMMPITPKAKKACIAAVQPGGMLHHLLPDQQPQQAT